MEELFDHPKPLIGMVHVRALPGTPAYTGNLRTIIETAVAEAKALAAAGMDGLLLENMHDVPYLKGNVGPEITAAMAVVAREVRKAIQLPIGVQVLAGANESALAVALAADLQFVRVEGFVFGHVGDEGWLEASAGPLLRFRKRIGASGIQVWTDIKKKHSAHAVTADVDLVETARAADFFRSQALILTGSSTGVAADVEELRKLKAGVRLPVVIGSGITAENLKDYFDLADAFIVGSSLKVDGHWEAPLDPGRISALVAAGRDLRESR